MDGTTPYWQSRLVNHLQGPSSLGMALSGGAVGFSASIIDPDAYVGFWTSAVFQMHAGLQFLSVACGVLFAICRLKSNEVSFRLDRTQNERAADGPSDPLSIRARRLAVLTKSTIYAQIFFLLAGAGAFVWLVLLHFHRALYP